MLTSMDIRQIAVFVTVVQTGSATAAGQVLGRSQSAITRIIQDLEHTLGLILFERKGPKITPTPHAFQLLGAAENVLKSLRTVQDKASSILTGEPEEIRLAATPPLATTIVPIALSQPAAIEHQRRVHIRNLYMTEVVQAVLSHTADVGLVSLPLDHKGLEVQWVREVGCAAVLPVSSPFAEQAVFRLGQLADQPLITLQGSFRLRHRIDEALEESGCLPRRVHETNSSLTAMQMVRAGQGIAIVEPMTALGTPLPGIVVRPIDIHIPFLFGVVTLKETALSPSIRRLVQGLEKAVDAVNPHTIRRDPADRDLLPPGRRMAPTREAAA